MQLKREDLINLIQEQMNQTLGGTEFTDQIKNQLKAMVEELKANIQTPFSVDQKGKIINNLGYTKIDGDYLTTRQGSVINLKNKSNPWVVVSDELGQWAIEFCKFVKGNNYNAKLLQESTDTAGGYLVPEEFKALMIMYDMEQTLVWNRATVWPMSGEKIMFPKLIQDPDVDSGTFDHFAGVKFSWTDEGGEKAETEPSFGLVEMIVHELSGYTEVTNILLDDSVINLINYLTRLFRAAWYWYTDKSFLRGSGAKQPMGIINDPAILTVTRQTAGTVTFTDIVNMEAKMPAIFDEGSVWFYSKKIRSALRNERDTVGGGLLLKEFHDDLTKPYNAVMLGRPAILADGKLPALGSFGDIVLGNWTHYYIGFRQDFVMDSSRHYKFRNNRTAIRCSGRVDGQAALPQAFVVLDDTTTS